MDRLSKKCVIASGFVHGTLVLVLLVGPAFLGSDSKPDTAPYLTIIPDNAISSGATILGQGKPNGGRTEPTPPPAIPKPPEPVPPTPKPVKPEQSNDPKPVERVPKPEPESPEPSNKHKPVINLTQVVRNPSKTATPKKNTVDEEAKAKAHAAALKAAGIAQLANNFQRNASPGVEVGPIGVSTGSGPSMAAYSDILRSIYFNSWREPSDATMEDAVVKVSVTVANDGSVISACITRSSGDPAVDKSVRHLIDSIPFIRAFPEDWKEKQKEFKLSFSLKAKRSLG